MQVRPILSLALIAAFAGCGGDDSKTTTCGTPLTLFDTGADKATAVAVDAEKLYYSIAGAGGQSTLYAVSKCGSERKALYTGPIQPSVMIARGGFVFVANRTHPSSLTAVPTGGGAPIVLAAQRDDVTFMAVDDAFVYYVDGIGVFQVPVGGGTPNALRKDAGSPQGVAVDGDSVYFVDRGDPLHPGSLSRMPKAGGDPVELVKGTGYMGGFPVGAIVLDDVNVYFGAWNRQIVSVPKAGGSTTVLSSIESPTAMATAGRDLYWVNGGSMSGDVDYGLKRMSRDGVVNATVLDKAAEVTNLASDGDGTYYVVGTKIKRVSR